MVDREAKSNQLSTRARRTRFVRWLLKKHGLHYVVRKLLQRMLMRTEKASPGIFRESLIPHPEFLPKLLIAGEPTNDFRPSTLPIWASRVYEKNLLEKHPDLYGILVRSGRVIGRHGWVETADGEIADDLWKWSTYPSSRFDASVKEYANEVTKNLSGLTAVLACPWAGNYWHFSLQSLARVKLAREFAQGREIDHWIIQRANAPFVAELLRYAEIEPSRVVELWSDSVACDEVIATTVPSQDVYVQRWVADYLREIVPRVDCQDSVERLFVTRGAVGGRSVLNAEELARTARKLGFEERNMDGRSVAEQASLFRSAKIVLAVHGAALTNLVYCSPGTLVIELSSVNYAWPAYHRLSTTMNLRHFQVLGKEFRQPLWAYQLDQGADMLVDLGMVESLMATEGPETGLSH